jgi:hypothetical protein
MCHKKAKLEDIKKQLKYIPVVYQGLFLNLSCQSHDESETEGYENNEHDEPSQLRVST